MKLITDIKENDILYHNQAPRITVQVISVGEFSSNSFKGKVIDSELYKDEEKSWRLHDIGIIKDNWNINAFSRNKW